jgi:enamine deaminase RidA (YjgF/YER057c/UK114 family)
LSAVILRFKRARCSPTSVEPLQARVTLFGDHKAADVVVGVAALSPDYLIEVDAMAVVDG